MKTHTLTEQKLIPIILPILLLIAVLFISACDVSDLEKLSLSKDANSETVDTVPEPQKGPHRGRLFNKGDFTLELAIFETGVPAEFRVWATKNNRQLAPDTVDLNITLTRLGGKVDDINFNPQGDMLRGDTVIYEPHSFIVTINAIHDGTSHRWQYDNFEGRTRIEAAVAEALEIGTEIAAPVEMLETITVYGQIAANGERVRNINARFDGLITSVFTSQGEQVNKGQKLAIIESNESLQLFTITAPITGVITQRDANTGEQTEGRQLFTIMDTTSLWAELSVFPGDLAKVKIGAPVMITDTTSGQTINAKVSQINVLAQSNQSVNVRVVVDNAEGELRPGRHISAKIVVREHKANLAVKRSGLQAFRDFTVVYALIGEEYEVRMLDLGLQAGEWAEVLSGLELGTRYVSENSYVIKADIEKSGASHDH